MKTNSQFRVEWYPGVVRLVIYQDDDGSSRSINVPAAVASQIGLGIIHAARIAQMPSEIRAAQETGEASEAWHRWVDDYSKTVH